MKHFPTSIKITLIMILLNAGVWLGFGIITVTGLHPSLPNSVIIRSMIGVLSFFTAGLLVVSFFLIKQRNQVGYWLTTILMGFLFLFTLLDELGLADLIVLIITLTPLILLIKDRTWYLSNRSNVQKLL